MVAIQMEEIWQKLPAGNGVFTVAEYGAGNGEMALDILQKLKNNRGLCKQLRYVIIEKSRALQQRLTEKVDWISDIKKLGLFCGCVPANEVLDNFAVHRVLMQDELMEVYVDYNWNTSFCVFGKLLDDNSGNTGQVSKDQLLSTTLAHEFCHLLDLVNQGSPMQAAHKDENNGAHCINRNCLMYYFIETSSPPALTIPTLDANCRNDLRANGGR